MGGEISFLGLMERKHESTVFNVCVCVFKGVPAYTSMVINWGFEPVTTQRPD